jgi:hypothetical protein
MALKGQQDPRTPMTPLKVIGLADGLAATKAGMVFKAEAAELIWRVCRKENIGAEKERIDALRNDGSTGQDDEQKIHEQEGHEEEDGKAQDGA